MTEPMSDAELTSGLLDLWRQIRAAGGTESLGETWALLGTDARYHRQRCAELEREVERLRAALRHIQGSACHECAGWMPDDLGADEFNRRMAVHAEAIARAALAPQAGTE